VESGSITTKIVLLDPPPDDDAVGAHGRTPLPTNLTADLVRSAALKMRQPVGVVRERPGACRGGSRTAPTSADDDHHLSGPKGEIALCNEYRPEKRHGWLEAE